MQNDCPGRSAAGGPEQLALGTVGILRVLSFQQPVGDARTPGTAVELAAHFGCQRVHEVRHLRGCGDGPCDHTAPHVLEDLEERDAVRVDSRACGQLHDDPDQAVVTTRCAHASWQASSGLAERRTSCGPRWNVLTWRYDDSASHLSR